MKAALYDKDWRVVRWIDVVEPPPPTIKIPKKRRLETEERYDTYYYVREVEYAPVAIYWVEK